MIPYFMKNTVLESILQRDKITCVGDLTDRLSGSIRFCCYSVEDSSSGITLRKTEGKKTEVIEVDNYFDLPDCVRNRAERWYDRFFELWEHLDYKLHKIDVNELNIHHGVRVYRMWFNTKASLEAIFEIIYGCPLLSYSQVNDNPTWQEMRSKLGGEMNVLYLIRSRCEGPSHVVPGEHVEVFNEKQLIYLATSIMQFKVRGDL